MARIKLRKTPKTTKPKDFPKALSKDFPEALPKDFPKGLNPPKTNDAQKSGNGAQSHLKLNPRQRLFVHAYLSNGNNGTDAAKKAGYSPKTAYSAANSLLKRPEVKSYLESLQKNLEGEFDLKADKVLTDIESARLMALDTKQPGAAIRASELHGRYLGMWADEMAGKQVQNNLIIASDDAKALLNNVLGGLSAGRDGLLKRTQAPIIDAEPSATNKSNKTTE